MLRATLWFFISFQLVSCVGEDVPCGDGVIEALEECDGSELGGTTCVGLGYEGGTLSCTAECEFDMSACEGIVCNDGEVGGDEVCEGDDLDGQTCESLGHEGGVLSCEPTCDAFDTSACTGDPCGNGIADVAEVCEGDDLKGSTCESLGYIGGELGCEPTCDAFDTSACVGVTCGDGHADGGEVCDGDDHRGEDCTTQGFDSGALFCAETCDSFITSGCTQCGDSVIEGDEVCEPDDLQGYECVDFGFTGGTLRCDEHCRDFDRNQCTGPGCGNDILEPGEVCDGDSVGVDCDYLGFDYGEVTCMGDCRGFDTTGCDTSTCGDSIAEGLEQCDQSDLRGEDCLTVGFIDGDLTCTSTCRLDTTECRPGIPPGDSCETAGIIDPSLIPFTLSGNISRGTNTYGTPHECPGELWDYPPRSPDVAYSFTPTESGVYTFRYDHNAYGNIFVVTDCEDIDVSCLSISDENLVLDLSAGTTYYIIMDIDEDWGRYEYTLEVSGPCTPICSGLSCGPDQCGLFCGHCDESTACDAVSQECVAPAVATGSTCANALTLPDAPSLIQGFTADMYDDYAAPEGSCPGHVRDVGDTVPDVAYIFTPSLSGRYTFVVESEVWAPVLYVVTDCDDIINTCLAGGRGEMTVDLESGVVYYIIVERGDAIFELTVDEPCLPDCTGRPCGTDGCGQSCGTCAAPDVCDGSVGLCLPPDEVMGETCSNPYVIDPENLPYFNTDDTTGSTNERYIDELDCPYNTYARGIYAGEHIYEFAPTTTAIYQILVDGANKAWYVVTDCENEKDSCIAFYQSFTSAWHPLLEAGTTYYIVVDGIWNQEGPYQIQVSLDCEPSCEWKECGDDGCGGSCGTCDEALACSDFQCVDPASIQGQTCSDPIIVSETPYFVEVLGDDLWAMDDHEPPDGACPGLPSPEPGLGADVVYALTPDVDATYRFRNDFVQTMYIVSDCSDIASSCIYGQSRISQPRLELTGGTNYYIIFEEPPGYYRFDISAPCIPSCSGECGSNGCWEGVCDTCEAPETCTPDLLLCEDPAVANGMTCSNAVSIPPADLPYMASGDTTNATDDYDLIENVCLYGAWPIGEGTGDNVFSFMPSITGSYVVTLGPRRGAVYVTTSCEPVEENCVAYTQRIEDMEGSQPVHRYYYWFESGTTYFIVVDGPEGPYTLSVE